MKSIGNRVGLVGWRGMVGSVLMDRMQAEHDFDLIEPVFFSTSNAGGAAPSLAKNETRLQDGHDIAALKTCDIILTCQGGDYTSEVFPKLRAAGWKGHWIDAASTLRMKDDAVIVLDPGHGEWDPGFTGNELTEKVLTLDVAKRVQRLLDEKVWS